MMFSAGDEVRTTVDGHVTTAVILGFNASGHSAAIRLTAPAPGYPEGIGIPVPVRLLEAAA